MPYDTFHPTEENKMIITHVLLYTPGDIFNISCEGGKRKSKFEHMTFWLVISISEVFLSDIVMLLHHRCICENHLSHSTNRWISVTSNSCISKS